tara:strand:+ start:6676 stop:7668 length:993 start_codon:yes stop_codon:yes gene_type:complete
MSNPAAEKLELVYDDQCPVCRIYCKNVIVDAGHDLHLIDARQGGDLMREVTARGLDIDEGMVLKIGSDLYYGSDAMHQISMRAQTKGWVSYVNRLFFMSPERARVFYAVGKKCRNAVLRILGIEYIDNLKPENTLKHQLGDQWALLNPNIQERFDKEPALGEKIQYEGVMHDIRRSRMGWLFAVLTRIIGNPLTPYAGCDVPMDVSLFKKPHKSGVFWQRTYFYPDKNPYSVISIKRESKDGEMLECVGGGFGMKLKVYVEDQSLHFKSYRFFWSVLKFKVPLPHWLTPGKTHVVHEDLGGGDFQFTISMHHGLLGETFYQQGVFRKKEG